MRPQQATTRLQRRHVIDSAWQRFVQDGHSPSGLSPEIARSWVRTRDQFRIDPSLRRPIQRLGPDALRARRDADDVHRLARPILEDFARRLGLTDQVLTFFDAEGWMLSIEGRPGVIEAVSEIDFRPGACWTEAAAGTNGPGTALAEGRPVEVFASEHYVSAWQPWSCAAAPILLSGHEAPVGLVDITGPWETQRREALATASAIARAVEERLGAARSVREEVLRHAFRAAHAAGDGLVAVNGRADVLAVNDCAARARVVEAGVLPPRVRAALQRLLASPPTERQAELTLELPDLPRLALSTILHDGCVVGAVVRAPATRAHPVPRGRAAARAPEAPTLPAPSRAGAERAGGRPPARAAAPALGAGRARYDFDGIHGEAPALRFALQQARVAAANALPVALFGESGTGKELFAHAIHAAGPRAGGPFVAVNCGSIPADLVEAELFGYHPGTFTGGRSEGKPGRFEDADGGTLFLDEVTELSGPAQTALLRVLQEREVVRLGGSGARPVDVRVIAASNRPLLEEVRAHRFRRDLYYRLSVLPIDVPPLRERGADVLLLAERFLEEAVAEVGRSGLTLSEEGRTALAAYAWPGNVRELRNVVLRAAAVAAGSVIGPADLHFAEAASPRAEPSPPPGSLRVALEHRERDALVAALDACAWNCSRAAQQLGISRMTLYRRMARHGLERPLH
jgi:transcriptional regulator of acetoin/glycerol metabolism